MAGVWNTGISFTARMIYLIRHPLWVITSFLAGKCPVSVGDMARARTHSVAPWVACSSWQNVAGAVLRVEALRLEVLLQFAAF